jgi:Bacterial Ig-like domain
MMKANNNRKESAMKKITRTVLALMGLMLIASCGSGTSDTSDTASGVVVSGAVDSSLSAQVADLDEGSEICIGEICGIVAYGEDGTTVEGAVNGESYTWEVRVSDGSWMFAFIDAEGNQLGYLEVNGATLLEIAGDDVDTGTFRYRHGMVEHMGDMEGMSCRAPHAQDSDFDGIPYPFNDEEELDPEIFAVLFLRPFDGAPNVAPCRPVGIGLTKAVDDTTVTAETVIVETEAGEVVDGELTIEENADYETYAVKFTPTDNFAIGEVIVVKILSGEVGMLSEEGESLAADIEISFTVRDFAIEGETCHELEPGTNRHRERARHGNGEHGDGMPPPPPPQEDEELS